ncbi:MAG TPA: amino acid adenylation domain-containing protein [Pyrinomonadaceae bacterium]|nr:amino acid adenylation domain-containing protein [Pyrinomonadaceae bacterium]
MSEFLSPEKRLLLAQALSSARHGKGTTIARRNSDDPAPLSFAQQRIWFIQQLHPDNPQYNTPVGVSLKGSLNIPALEQTLTEIVRRHEVMRTVFRVTDGQPAQVILPAFDPRLTIKDLSEHPVTDRQIVAQQIIDEESGRPFDLEAGPLVRFLLLRLAPNENWLNLVTHHMVFDTWSIDIFGRELSAIYGALIDGSPFPLQDLPIQYADFSLWQRQRFQGEELQQQLAYWTAKLSGAPPLLMLPTDRPRPPLQSYRGRIQPFSLSEGLTASLNQLSRAEGVTLFMTLMAAFQTLLHCYSGQEEIVAGTATGNRNRREMEGLIGCFINSLLFRTNFSGDPPFRAVLDQVRRLSLEASAHQDVPFEQVVAALHPQRDLSYAPLTQVMLNFQNTQLNTPVAAGLEISRLGMPERMAAQYDLTINLRDSGSKLHGLLEYNTDLFDATTAQRILGHFETVLESIVTHSERRVSALEVMTEPERLQQISGLNETRTEFWEHGFLPDLIQRQAAQRPEAVAMTFEGQRLTYDELNSRANQLAHHLRGLGVGPEELVGVCLERGLGMVVALLGILKAGGAYLPLDPTYPRERLEFMINDSGPSVLLTQEKFSQPLSSARQQVVCIDSDWERIAFESPENPDTALGAANLAYVLYTSGSTGVPKGVMVTHGALKNFLLSTSRLLEMTRDDVLAAVTTLAFDIAGLELYLPLIVGARVGLVSRETGSDGRLLRDEIINLGATALQGTPATWRMLLGAGLQLTPSFKVFCGGEAMTGDLKEKLLDTGAKVWNLYGPTETTIWSTVKRLDPDCPPSIGQPLANTQIYILNRSLQPTPVGVAGELYIAGAGLARGYLKRPELTAERFIPNPFSSEPGARLYRTGDLVRYLPNYDIEYLDRIDLQIKIRGFRIELGEIETVLGQHPDVRQAVVAARENPSGEKVLVAYVVHQQGVAKSSPVRHEELREFLRRSLPAYMIPSAFVLLDELPKSPAGKIDRKALHELQPLDQGKPFVAPSTPTELLVAGIWSELLGTDRISADDDFFELGGDSLLIQRMLAKVMQAVEVTVPLGTVFQNPSVSHIAAIIDRTREISLTDETRLNDLVSNLSDEQIDSLLSEALAESGSQPAFEFAGQE